MTLPAQQQYPELISLVNIRYLLTSLVRHNKWIIEDGTALIKINWNITLICRNLDPPD